MLCPVSSWGLFWETRVAQLAYVGYLVESVGLLAEWKENGLSKRAARSPSVLPVWRTDGSLPVWREFGSTVSQDKEQSGRLSALDTKDFVNVLRPRP